jgi:hypothetical protein
VEWNNVLFELFCKEIHIKGKLGRIKYHSDEVGRKNNGNESEWECQWFALLSFTSQEARALNGVASRVWHGMASLFFFLSTAHFAWKLWNMQKSRGNPSNVPEMSGISKVSHFMASISLFTAKKARSFDEWSNSLDI